MTLEDILEILPTENIVHIVFSIADCFIEGDVDSILCRTNNITLKSKVINIEPRNNNLWIWTKE